MIDAAKFRGRLKEFGALRDTDDIKDDVVARIQPQYAAEWPGELHQSVRSALTSAGPTHPYQHQNEAINKVLQGVDVVMESPTASGKTLAFTAPMLDSLLRNRDSHALMIYPMKALAFDQREQIRQLCAPLSVQSWPYDADTPESDRKLLRASPPQILLTNPEYLNMSFLGWSRQWDGFLRNLRYVVIDEMHEYRGFFGGNMALLLRRFLLHLNRIGVSPRLFLSTATCANPEEHARNLTGRNLEVVSARGVLRPQRHYIFVKPDIPDFQYRDFLRLRVEQAALAALTEGLQVLIFCPTKRFLEEAFSNCRRKAPDYGADPQKISAFHADLKNDDRQDVQQKIKSGDINVVFTTNALELGLDIGGLDGVVLAGFPPSIMSAWQQIGRAGRGWDKDAFVLFYAMNDPIDSFFVGNLDAFLNKPFDELVVDPDNEELIENHLSALAWETGGELYPSDELILGKTFYAVAKRDAAMPSKVQPHPRLNMRGGFGQSYALKRGHEEVGQISAMRRFREAYIGAVFPFFGQKYRVHSHEQRAVVLNDAEQNLRTDASFFSTLSLRDIFSGYAYGDLRAHYGSLNLAVNFAGYRVVDSHTNEEKDWVSSSDAHYQNNLHAFWLDLPEGEDTTGGIGVLEHMIRVGAMFVIPADRFDTSTYSKHNEQPSAYCYENYSGGIGVAKKLFDVWQTAMEKGIEIARHCPCHAGCQNCIEPAKSYDISNAVIDKRRGIALATELLEKVRAGPDMQFHNGRWIPVRQ